MHEGKSRVIENKERVMSKKTYVIHQNGFKSARYPCGFELWEMCRGPRQSSSAPAEGRLDMVVSAGRKGTDNEVTQSLGWVVPEQEEIVDGCKVVRVGL